MKEPKRNNNTMSSFYKKEMILNANRAFNVANCLEPNSKRYNVETRAAIAYFSNMDKGLTLHATGKIINKDHSNVMHLKKLHMSLLRFNKEYKLKYDLFIQSMKGTTQNRWLCIETTFNIQRYDNRLTAS